MEIPEKVQEYITNCNGCSMLIGIGNYAAARIVLETYLVVPAAIAEVSALVFLATDRRRSWFEEAAPRALLMLDQQLEDTSGKQIDLAATILQEASTT